MRITVPAKLGFVPSIHLFFAELPTGALLA
jgi:hypothetical protein